MATFGEFIKGRRMALGLTLRAFCAHHEEDPSNWSKLERGILRPPTDETRLDEIARILALESGEAQQMKDHAYAEAGRIPKDIMDNAELLAHLPVMFRTIRNESLTLEQLQSLAELIRKENSPQ